MDCGDASMTCILPQCRIFIQNLLMINRRFVAFIGVNVIMENAHNLPE